MNRREFHKFLLSLPFVGLFVSSAKAGSRDIEPGQIWAGNCVTSYEPNLWFYYVILSRDREDGIDWWSVAEFMNGTFGAPVRKLVEEEVRRLDYIGCITDFKRLNSRPKKYII